MLYEVGRAELDLLGLMRPLTFFPDIFFCTIRFCNFLSCPGLHGGGLFVACFSV